jgi:cytochrome P450
MLAPAIALFTAVYTTFLVLRYFQQLYKHRKQARSLRCQPPIEGQAGIFGISAFLRLKKAVKEKRWIELIAEQYVKYGNTFTQSIFGRPMVATIEPENLKALLATQFNDFELGTRHQEFYPLLGDGIFTLDGAGWSHARALLRPQFTRDQVSDCLHLLEPC